MVKKKRRLKKKVKIFIWLFIIVLLLVSVSFFVIKLINKNVDNNDQDIIKENKVDSDKVISEIVSYDIGVSEYFLKLIYNDYGVE